MGKVVPIFFHPKISDYLKCIVFGMNLLSIPSFKNNCWHPYGNHYWKSQFLKMFKVYFLNQKWAVFKGENKNNQIWTVAAVYVIISNLAIFSFDLEERYFSNNELTLILKIIGLWPQTCHAITNRNNNIWFEELSVIPVKMSVSTFYTDVILYFFDQVIC